MSARVDAFPEAVRNALKAVGTCITCLPVQFDQGEWETAIFFVLAIALFFERRAKQMLQSSEG